MKRLLNTRLKTAVFFTFMAVLRTVEASPTIHVPLIQSPLLSGSSQHHPAPPPSPDQIEIAVRLRQGALTRVPSHLNEVSPFKSTLFPGLELAFHSPENWELWSGGFHWSTGIGLQALFRKGEIRYAEQPSRTTQSLYLLTASLGGHWSPDRLSFANLKGSLSIHLLPTLALTDRSPGDEGSLGAGLIVEVRPETQVLNFFNQTHFVLAAPFQFGRLNLSPDFFWSLALHTGVRIPL